MPPASHPAAPASAPPQRPSLDGLEAKWGARWERDGTYRFDRSKTRADVFSIDTPPPTVSGSLHVGHVFSYTHTDLSRATSACADARSSIRWASTTTACRPSAASRTTSASPASRRCRTTPASSPATAARRGRSRGRTFLELCERLTLEDERAFEAMWRALGLSVDWDLTYTTIGTTARRVSQRSFLDLLRRGLAYQARRRRSGTPTSGPRSPRPSSRTAPSGRAHRVALRPRATASGLDRSRRRGRSCCRRASRSSPIPTTSATAADRRRRRARRSSAPRSRSSPTPGRPGEGHRPRDGVHVRRPHRRHLVARARAARAPGPRTRTRTIAPGAGARRVAERRRRPSARGSRRARRASTSSAPAGASRAARRRRRPARARPARSPTR